MVVAAKTHLFSLEDDVAVIVHTCVDGGFCTALAHGFDLAY